MVAVVAFMYLYVCVSGTNIVKACAAGDARRPKEMVAVASTEPAVPTILEDSKLFMMTPLS